MLIENSSDLISVMGYWPSFHDATVVEASRDDSSFSILLHVFAMTDRVDEAGYYVLEKHHLVWIDMLGVKNNSMPPTYASDCLDRISFSRSGELLQVDLDSHMGNDGRIICSAVRVAGVTPCSSKGVPVRA